MTTINDVFTVGSIILVMVGIMFSSCTCVSKMGLQLKSALWSSRWFLSPR
jgi:hypothetical protein